jgi:hypothetical protein
MNRLFVNPQNQPLATYAFLSWLRRGISTEIEREDSDIFLGDPVPRAKAPVTVKLEQSTSDGIELLDPTAHFELYGPGEITGCDQRVVIRLWPQPDVANAETNFFPMVECDQADLPWRYTPAKAPGTDRLRPWLCLIALAEGEFDLKVDVGPNRPLPRITVSTSKLPDLRQSWAWAHVQVSIVKPTDPPVGPDFLAQLLATQPHRVVSRLLAPRQLLPRTAYTAFLVPTFERGRQRGLGDEPGDEVDGLKLAWESSGVVELPVYFHWRFQTGERGDFESLVRQLKARALPPTVGIRDMDVSDPGLKLPPASSTPLGLEGALMSISTRSTEWKEAEREDFVTALQARVNEPADFINPSGPSAPPPGSPVDKTVAPPLYARWHAASDRLNPGGLPVWFQQLNADPRLRVTAGLGTQVVQAQQRQLLAGAWEQVGRVREANEMLRLGQMMREVLTSIQLRHLASFDAGTTLLITTPVHSRVRSPSHLVTSSASFGLSADAAELTQSLAGEVDGQRTLQALFSSSPISSGAFDAQFRVVLRARGPIGRRQGRDGLPRSSNFLELMNRGQLSAAPIPPAPAQMTTPKRVGQFLLPNWCTQIKLEEMSRQPRSVLRDDLMRRWQIRDGRLTAEEIQHAPPRRNFTAAEPSLGIKPPVPPPPPAGGGVFATDSASAREFRNAAAATFARVGKLPDPSPPLMGVSIQTLRSELMAAIDPGVTITASIRSRLGFAPNFFWQPLDPLEPIIPAPEFLQPMYKPLAELSQDWLLPGLDQVPPNTISLLVTNQRFVEAFMAGLNHEMSRELLYNEYPASLRGTYFRQFWSVAGFVAPPGQSVDPETLKDIKHINRWSKSAALGQNSSRRLPPGGQHLVLLIRGELLRRYPNTIVYAVKAQVEAGQRVLSGEEKHPIFNGSLTPDVSFYGFELTASEVRGKANDSRQPGWFFVLKEAPGEPRFGLDVADEKHFNKTPQDWNALSWAHLAANQGDLDSIDYIDLTRPLPHEATNPAGALWHANASPRGSTAADLAFITLQKPVRIAIHGSDMLPPP